ncbi:MAG: A/G-specific adenine glycosylase [Lachnospiraceae bacterium]|nr:A/G-specific adenine glycosylase [Lachnospiraceae bacterium]
MRDTAEKLLNWYEKNRRILPWREDPSPYHVWISEIMLQQTRVEAVKPYYERFLAELPDVASLAAVSEDRLMKLWEGLGYYSRARNLKRAAIRIMEDCGGKLPKEPAELMKLPGIGPYTAGAVASIAFGACYPAVDGNALRIWTRLTENAGDIGDDRVKRAVTQEIAAVLPDTPFAAGRINQAFMDLGSMVCLPNSAPRCDLCPLADVCGAHDAGRETDYPVKAAKKPRRIEKRTILLIEDEGRILLKKRPARGLLAGLYELPGVEGHLSRAQVLAHCRGEGIEPLRITALPPAKHIFTHIEWHMIGYRIRVDALSDFFPGKQGGILADKQEISTRYSIPSAFSNYILYSM